MNLPLSAPLAPSLLVQSRLVARVWPAFDDLRGAARAPKAARLRLAISALLAEARLVMGACFLTTPLEPSPPAPSAGSLLHSWVKELLRHGSTFLLSEWHWSTAQVNLLQAQLSGLASSLPWPGSHDPVPTLDVSWVDWDALPRPYPAAYCVFFHALRVGLPWDNAMELRAPLSSGFLSPDGRIFVPAEARAYTAP